MAIRKSRLNQFGMDVAIFCGKYGFSAKGLAELAGVERTSIWNVGTGRRSGLTVIPRVKKAMEAYEREHGEDSEFKSMEG